MSITRSVTHPLDTLLHRMQHTSVAWTSELTIRLVVFEQTCSSLSSGYSLDSVTQLLSSTAITLDASPVSHPGRTFLEILWRCV